MEGGEDVEGGKGIVDMEGKVCGCGGEGVWMRRGGCVDREGRVWMEGRVGMEGEGVWMCG